MVMTSRYAFWVGIMAALAIVLPLAGQVGVLDPFQNAFITVTRPIERGLNATFQPVADFLSYDDEGLRAENQRLRDENADLQRRLSTALTTAARVEDLERILALLDAEDAPALVAAQKVSIDRSPGHSVLVINKGESDGIAPGMVVLSDQQTLIGTVTDVVANHAFVRLIDDGRSRVNVRIRSTEVPGTLRGDISRNLSLEFVQADVAIGADVVTSGLGGTYPPDLFIGRVSSVSGSDQDLTRSIAVEPAVRLSTVEFVLINTSFVPQVISAENR